MGLPTPPPPTMSMPSSYSREGRRADTEGLDFLELLASGVGDDHIGEDGRRSIEEAVATSNRIRETMLDR